MASLAELLPMPTWRKQKWAWQQLTAGDSLFRALQEAVRNRSVGDAMRLAQSWRSSNRDKSLQIGPQWDIVLALVWCAEQAATSPDFYCTHIDEVGFAAVDVPEFIKRCDVWAWICIRILLGAPRRHAGMPVAGWNKQHGENGGFLATLFLDVLDSGAGQVVHHPVDAFSTQADDEFRSSMHNAWKAARNLLQKQGVDVADRDATWRLLDGWSWNVEERQRLAPSTVANDRSASSAAAWGWWFALQGKVPDNHVVVLAQINADGQLEEVDGVPAKTKAIVRAGHFDKIVVASPKNEAEANGILKASKVQTIKVELL